MYVPKMFKVSDIQEIKEFVQQHSFGTLVTIQNGRPIATHIPLVLDQEGDDLYITGHMALGNPQWRTLQQCDEVLVMYQGPHAYISSSWYGHENVPTWNYQAVHMYGKPQILEKEELKIVMKNLLKKYESHRENPVLWETVSPELLEKELKGIVGFKIKVTEVQAAYKLSQNRNDEDYKNIMKKLNEEKDATALALSSVMKDIKR